MELKRKHMTRWEWPPVRKAALRMEYVESSVFTGAMGLLTFVEPVAPVRVPGLTIADRGYEWLQAAPRHGRWWLTAMWDGNGRYFQSYFDMTLDVDFSDPRDPVFTDLLLDVVFPLEGEPVLLDEPELERALTAGNISLSAYMQAQDAARGLIRWYGEHRKEYLPLLETARSRLKTLPPRLLPEQL